MLPTLRHRSRQIASYVANLGPVGAARYIALRLLDRRGRLPPRPAVLHPPGAAHPVRCRPGTSDLDAYGQIFGEREYGCLDHLRGVDLIIDCGANVGFSSAYFLNRFPGAFVVAVEPDPDNFRALQENLAAYSGRVRLVQAAVWSHPAGLVLRDEKYRDGRGWTRQVRECRPGEAAAVRATDVATLLKESGRARVALLKIDVEGAEAVIFSGGCGDWLPRVDALAVELHDDTAFGDASGAFAAAVGDREFRVRRSGELTVCERRRPAGGP
jgi:FkbM family methyltransferase